MKNLTEKELADVINGYGFKIEQKLSKYMSEKEVDEIIDIVIEVVRLTSLFTRRIDYLRTNYPTKFGIKKRLIEKGLTIGELSRMIGTHAMNLRETLSYNKTDKINAKYYKKINEVLNE